MSISSLSRAFALSLGLILLAFFGYGGSDAKPAPAPTAEIPSPSTTESPVTRPMPESGSAMSERYKSILKTDKEDMDGNN